MFHSEVTELTINVLQSFILVWLDENLDETNENLQNEITNLQNIVDSVHRFNEPDPFIDFITDIDDQQVFAVVSETVGQQLMPDVHACPWLVNVYILEQSADQRPMSTWIASWPKIRGRYTHISLIYQDLQLALKQFNRDSLPISFVALNDTNNISFDSLEPSFMYTRLFKDTFLDMEYDDQARTDLVTYCRQHLPPSNSGNKVLDESESEYSPKTAIWWYTRECFTYQLLNTALRLFEADIIVLMGFFIRDLHRQIEQLQQKQNDQYRAGRLLTVYRGQRLCTLDFQKLQHAQGGLISFNSFLSTSRSMDVPRVLAESAALNTGFCGIFFIINVDSHSNHAVFADISEVSYLKEEDEVLFSMHSMFRITNIAKMDHAERLYAVSLTLATKNDETLALLAESIRAKIFGHGKRRWMAE